MLSPLPRAPRLLAAPPAEAANDARATEEFARLGGRDDGREGVRLGAWLPARLGVTRL